MTPNLHTQVLTSVPASPLRAQLPVNAPGKAQRVTAQQLMVLPPEDGALGFWSQAGPALGVMNIWEVNQTGERFLSHDLSHSAFQIKINNFKNYMLGAQNFGIMD